MESEDPKEVVKEQAEDEAIWLTNLDGQEPIVECMLRTALRRLHAAVEGETFLGQKGKFVE